MASPFVHVEVLGPRAQLDAWLATVQDHAGCHLADAMQGLDGERGIGRPLPSADEREGSTLRSATAHRLRAIERILPGTAESEDPAARPGFAVGFLGEGRADLERLCTQASDVAIRLAEALERGRAADHALQNAQALRLAVAALAARGWNAEEALAFRLPLGMRGVRGLIRQLGRLGAEVGRAEGARDLVLTVRVPAEGREAVRGAVQACGGQDVVWPEEVLAARPRAAEIAEAAWNRARDEDAAALKALRERIDADGATARAFLDALEDAEAREALHRRLASTEYVTALRAYVRPEAQAPLARALAARFGENVVVRTLPTGPDEPTVPRAAAGLPFTALVGLRPRVYGAVSAAALLALVVPLAVGVALADIGAGLLLMMLGGLLGIGAASGSPRRDTSLLAQIGGVASLVLGILLGRVFGDVGAGLLGSGWGILGANALRGFEAFVGARPAAPLVVVSVLGLAASLAGAWGLLLAASQFLRGQGTRAREALLGAAPFVVVAGGATAFVAPAGTAGNWAWWLVPAGLLMALVLAGSHGLGRLVLELVGVARLTAVAFLGVAAFAWATGELAAPAGAAGWVLAPLVLLVTLLAVLIDPAHVAMGVPYDLSLGSRGLGQPYAPFARRVVRGRSLDRGA